MSFWYETKIHESRGKTVVAKSPPPDYFPWGTPDFYCPEKGYLIEVKKKYRSIVAAVTNKLFGYQDNISRAAQLTDQSIFFRENNSACAVR